MNAPRMCPNCGTELVYPLSLYSCLSAWFAGKLRTTTDLHVYRCDNSHLFVVFDDQKGFEESDAILKGSHPFL
jgi:hypothetical protein